MNDIQKAIKIFIIGILALIVFDTCEFDFTVRKEKYNLLQSIASSVKYVWGGYHAIRNIF